MIYQVGYCKWVSTYRYCNWVGYFGLVSYFCVLHFQAVYSCGQPFNTQYMTNSTLVSPVKMEYGWNFSISGIKMMVKSGLKNIFLNSSMPSPCYIYYWICTFDQNSVIKMPWWAHGGISKIFFLDHFSSSFLGQKC